MKPIDNFFTLKELNTLEEFSQRCLDFSENDLDEYVSDYIYKCMDLMDRYSAYKASIISSEMLLNFIENLNKPKYNERKKINF